MCLGDIRGGGFGPSHSVSFCGHQSAPRAIVFLTKFPAERFPGSARGNPQSAKQDAGPRASGLPAGFCVFPVFVRGKYLELLGQGWVCPPH